VGQDFGNIQDKNLTLEAWREIGKIVHPDFESLDKEKEKK
jgi:hypothetical protein